ncbi:hypothetical protein N9R04_09370 [Staphylococcus sp. SQ8-PEA]|uniref:Uncharacterized protein n=1 Tax=Staphylococcus marylandisciuri TaxID=2981529 RepID=A0ABT2QSE0_9STAP|nr:hypothetical protein [Staphylococcus marylandisciuri]MCU5746885.1 hypothetical protein [Staphylococcus marylandisciuri]
MEIISLIIIFCFSVFLTVLMNKYLPSNVSDVKTKYNPLDERQQHMFTEMLAKSFVTLVYAFMLLTILNLFDLHHRAGPLKSFATHHLELVFLICALVSFIGSFISTKRKYTIKD